MACEQTRFGRAESGAVAVEFALMAIPLASMLLLLLDLHGNDETFRRIDAAGAAVVSRLRDGSAQASAYDVASARRDLVCPRLPRIDCGSVVVALTRFDSPMRLTASDVSAAQWCPGAGQDALIFQLAYPVPFLTRFWAGDLESRRPFFVSSFALRNPPGAPASAC